MTRDDKGVRTWQARTIAHCPLFIVHLVRKLLHESIRKTVYLDAARRVDLPALGMPTKPTSATIFNSTLIQRSAPISPKTRREGGGWGGKGRKGRKGGD